MLLPVLPCAVLYRNSMQEIARFLQTYHRGHAKVYNLCSEHTYSAQHLSVAVQQYPYDDHQVGGWCCP
jgi:phosphatidylinositol-3,4,5-trisphosphate 3-phosphatase/dual-specificity protein phosphatase PTEN